MLVTIKYNQSIGDFKAVEKIEQFPVKSIFEIEGTSILYCKVNDFEYKTVSKNEVVSIEIKHE